MLKTIEHKTLTNATKLAKKTNDNVYVILGEINGQRVEMLATTEQYKASTVKASIEVLATIDTNGDFVE